MKCLMGTIQHHEEYSLRKAYLTGNTMNINFCRNSSIYTF